MGFEFGALCLQSRHLQRWRCGLANCLPTLTSNLDLPNLSLPSSEDYRCEQLAPGLKIFLKTNFSLAPVTHTCNPSYSDGRDQEDYGSKLA
jgi:hypothetical protein